MAQSFTENRKKFLLDHPVVSCNDVSVWMSTIAASKLLTNQEWVYICIQYINILQYVHFIYKHTYIHTYILHMYRKRPMNILDCIPSRFKDILQRHFEE